MKKLAILMVPVALAAVSAHAECFDGFWTTLGCSLIGTTVGPTLTTLGVNEGKEGYVEQVREQAADFVAAGAEAFPAALLKDAIQQIREKNPEATHELADREIAFLILNAE